ncbi:MAG: hypothetical protein IJA82_02585 [Clostridia bacterium]|nr:hypothetical protein [Clostridia bacterium]
MEYNEYENNQLENEPEEDKGINPQANSNINYVLRNFEEVEESYEKAKRVLTKEMVALWEMIAYERKQADLYRNKVQAEDVMGVILPFLSDIVNDVEDATDLDEAKRIVGIYLRSMKTHLMNIGVELKMHTENDVLDPTERVGGSCKKTGDKSLDGKIARTSQIGCVIHNEVPTEIQENVIVYTYDPELDKELPPDEPPVEEVPEEKSPVIDESVEDTPVEDAPTDEESVEDIPGIKLYENEIQFVNPVEDKPVEDVPVDDTPVEDEPVDDTPVEDTPVDDTPIEDEPVDDTPVEDEPVDDTPAEDEPVDDTPAEGEPVDDTPIEDVPVEDEPVKDDEPVIRATVDENGRYLLCECFRIISNKLKPYTRTTSFKLNQGYPYSFKANSVISMYVGDLCIVSEYKTENEERQLRACVDEMDGQLVFLIREGRKGGNGEIIAQFKIII